MKPLNTILTEASAHRKSEALACYAAHGEAAQAHQQKKDNAHDLTKKANELSAKLDKGSGDLEAEPSVFSHDKIQSALERRYKL